MDLGIIVRDVDELAVLNDKAHHIHDAGLAWFKSIEEIHNRLKQKGVALSMQVDTTATPRHNNALSSCRRRPFIRWWRRSRRMWSNTL
ncbi:MAG: hypothetical protein M0022_04150 [Desulfobacteraceae bacterium]|nr:hypothetical protein [Desulfobacteraceae bacterium]